MMGKVGNKHSVEIIPINNNLKKSKKRIVLYSNPFRDRNVLKMQRSPYFGDPLLLPRVQKYLESNVDKTYVDINLMADELQKTYKDYTRKKQTPFRLSVKKAYQEVLRSYGLDESRGSSSEEEVSDESASETHSSLFANQMSNQLLNMYARPAGMNPLNENELIDISSDDSDDNQDKAKSNGPSTSVKNDVDDNIYINTNTFQNALRDYQAQQQFERGKKRKFDDGFNPQPFNKKKKSLAVLQEPSLTFKDVGGLENVLIDVCKLLTHVQHPEVYRQIGVNPPRGFLLHGPPGCGKTLLANAIAGELGVALLKVAATELVAGVSGESEERIRELFERAICSSPCVLFIDEIDAITQNRQNANKDMERRIVAQLLSCMDDLNQNKAADRVLVIGATNRPDSIDPALRRAGRFDREISLGIPDQKSRAKILQILTAKLKLSDNFDLDTISKYTPGYVGADLMSLTREAALIAVNRMISKLQIKQKTVSEKTKKKKEKSQEIDSSKSDSEIIVDDIPAEKNASKDEDSDPQDSRESSILVIDDDLKSAEAGAAESTSKAVPNGTISKLPEEKEPTETNSVKKVLTPLEELLFWLHQKVSFDQEQLSSLSVDMEDFLGALKYVQPSAKREGFATVPDVSWDDVGSLKDVREELQMTILAPVKHAEQFKQLGLEVPAGVLLCGPPGCGKTLLAKAVANEAGINFISVKGPELLNMYVGESERAVRVCFERARNSAPCVIFFDELDALCPKRSDSREGGSTMRVVNQLLTEMDGIQSRNGVYILAATNRPDIIDPAVLRPGRLDKILYVGLPSASDRVDILKTITKNGTKPPLAANVNLELIGKSVECQGYTGADLAALVREAATIAIKEAMSSGNTTQKITVSTDHFTKAVAKIRPSVPEKDQKHYEKLRKMYATSPQDDVEEMELS